MNNTVLRHKEPMSIGEVLSASVLSPKRENNILRRSYVFALWAETVGATMEKYTRSLFLQGKKLFVELDSSVARSELFMLRDDIAQRINSKAGDVVVEEIILK
jgi:hypothetical protein